MNQFSPFGFSNFDPSKMDPKLLMQLSQLIQQLPPEQLQRMQTLMHNAMAGFDVRKDMEEFEKNLPPEFREKLISVIGTSSNQTASSSVVTSADNAYRDSNNMNLYEARLTILRAVKEGKISPEQAEKLLFPEK
jgi:hypothetical protein